MLKLIKVSIVVFLILLAIGVSTILLLRRVLIDDMEATYRNIARIQFQCPDGTTDAIERWGEAGYMRFCKRGEVKDGPWTAWEAQDKNIEGGYRNEKSMACGRGGTETAQSMALSNIEMEVEIRKEDPQLP